MSHWGWDWPPARRASRSASVTAASLVHELIEAVDERRLQRFQKQLTSQNLLIIDELGLCPLEQNRR